MIRRETRDADAARPRGEERADEVSAVDDAISAVLPDGLRIAAAVHHVMVALGASGR